MKLSTLAILLIIMGCQKPVPEATAELLESDGSGDLVYFTHYGDHLGNITEGGLWGIESKGGRTFLSDSPGVNYQPHQKNYLEFKPIQINGDKGVTLSFETAYELEESYDFGYVDINVDKQGWRRVMRLTGTSGWTTKKVFLDDYFSKSTKSFRFRMVLESDFIHSFDGWHIDHIKVTYQIPKYCVDLFDTHKWQDGACVEKSWQDQKIECTRGGISMTFDGGECRKTTQDECMAYDDPYYTWQDDRCTALDARRSGPYEVYGSAYNFPPQIHEHIHETDPTELWANIFMPKPQNPHEVFPIVVFLHGNHFTCGTGPAPRLDNNNDYTFKGSCPDGYQVVPSHDGFNYITARLASNGYVVVSVNANRGITSGRGTRDDPHLILARGSLVLSHLKKLNEWNQGVTNAPEGPEHHPSLNDPNVPEKSRIFNMQFVRVDVDNPPDSMNRLMTNLKDRTIHIPLEGRLDFSQVGLVGHSRGGEGMRAAHNLYLNRVSGMVHDWQADIGPMAIKGIFEIATTDTELGLNAFDTNWSALVAGCDQDLGRPEGFRVYDRMLREIKSNPSKTTPYEKSTYYVSGANHNYFNTQWHVSDSSECDHQTPLFASGKTLSGARYYPDTPGGVISSMNAPSSNSPHDDELQSIKASEVGSIPQQAVGANAVMAFIKGYVGPRQPTLTMLFNPLYENPSFLSDVKTESQFLGSTMHQEIIFLSDLSPDEFLNSNIEVTKTDLNHFKPRKWMTFNWFPSQEQLFHQIDWQPTDLQNYNTLDFDITRPSGQIYSNGDASFSVQILNSDGDRSIKVPLKKFAKVVGPFWINPIKTVRIPLHEFGLDLADIIGIRFTFDQNAGNQLQITDIRASKHPIPNIIQPKISD